MKHLLVIILIIIVPWEVFSQKNELTISLNSGTFSYAGISAVGTSFINTINGSTIGYTNNPYGTKPGFCDGVSIGFSRITKIHLIYGLDFGFETLRSKVSLTSIVGVNDTTHIDYSATGQTYLITNCLNFFPYIGYRLLLGSFAIDIKGGYEYGDILSSYEEGRANASNGKTYTTYLNRKNLDGDVRSRIQLEIFYKHLGIYGGYSYGLSNYMTNLIGDSIYESYSRLIRFGITYKI